jgi:hypothetical protein
MPMPLTDAQMKSMVQWMQFGQVAVPIIVTSVQNLIAFLKSKQVDPAVYAELQAIIDEKQAEADAEAAAHGHPHK